MSKSNGDVIEFDFQKIDLSEIPKLVPAVYRSKYAALRAQVIDKINSMNENESFVFKPRNVQRVSDNFVGRIILGVNSSLHKEHLNWRILWSKEEKVFVVAPYKRKFGTRTKAQPEAKPAETEQTGFKDSPDQRFHNLVHLVNKVFKVTLRQLQAKQGGAELSDLKSAVLYVGRSGLGLTLSDMAKRLDFSVQSASSLINRVQSKATANEKANQLIAALNRS